MRLYFVRHGESSANVLGEMSNSESKHPLTETGVEQAHATARRLAGMTVAQIYSSPILRAVQTAHILSESLLAPVEVTDALREWSVGIFEGTRDSGGWALHRLVQDDWFLRHKLDSRMPGGESYLDIQERFFPFVEKLVCRGRESDRNVVLVGHAGLYIAMLPALFTNIDRGIADRRGFPYASYVLAEARPDGLYCLSWGGAAEF